MRIVSWRSDAGSFGYPLGADELCKGWDGVTGAVS